MKRIRVVLSTCKKFKILTVDGGEIIKKGDKIIAETVSGAKAEYTFVGPALIKTDCYDFILKKGKTYTYVATDWFDNITRKTWLSEGK